MLGMGENENGWERVLRLDWEIEELLFNLELKTCFILLSKYLDLIHFTFIILKKK